MADALQMQLFSQYGPQFITAVTNLSLDDSGDGLGFVFQPQSADPITHLGFRYGTRTGTPPTYIASLQALTTGLPNGTILGGGTPASVTFTPPADTSINNTWIWYALANAYTPATGDRISCCVEYSSGTIDASNFSSFGRRLGGQQSAIVGFPYHVTKAASTWAKTTSETLFGYRTANGRYGIIGTGMFATNIATTGQRSTMHFTLPAGHGDTFTVSGAHLQHRIGATATTMRLGIWNAAGTELQGTTFTSDEFQRLSDDISTRLLFAGALATLSYGTKYYIGWESISSSSIGLRGMQLAEAADRSAFPNGVNRGFSSWNGSAWSDNDTVMPQAELILGDITEPAAGGGGPAFGASGQGPSFRGAAA